MISFFFSSILSIGLFFFFLVALLSIWKNEGMETITKVLWTLGVFFFPFVGPLAWFLIGKK